MSAAPLLASFAGNASRVGQMLEEMDAVDEEHDRAFRGKAEGGHWAKDGTGLQQQWDVNRLCEFKSVTLRTPVGAMIVKELNLIIQRKKNIVIVGPSGCGKTCLIRYMRGLWPISPSAGSIDIPVGIGPGGVLFVPQRPYVFHGSLQRQIIFPSPSSREEEVWDEYAPQTTWLRRVGLGSLLGRHGWTKERAWQDILSQGEAQRLSLLRVAYYRPALAVLDESTSALTPELEAECYSLLRDLGVTYLSIAHRNSVMAHHDLALVLDGSGGWTISDASSVTL